MYFLPSRISHCGYLFASIVLAVRSCSPNFASPTEAQALPRLATTGDIFIVDTRADRHYLLQIDPVSGTQEVISDNFVTPVALGVESDGHLIVVDGRAGAILRVNPTTGTQIVVSAGGYLVNPMDVAIASNGDLYITTIGDPGPSPTDRILRIDALTGNQSVVTSGGYLLDAPAIAIDGSGQLVVANTNNTCFECNPTNVIRIDPATGSQTIVSSGGHLHTPPGIAIDRNGDILVADRDGFGPSPSIRGPGGIIRIDPVTGNQSVVSSGGLFSDPSRLAIDAEGDILVSDYNEAPGDKDLGMPGDGGAVIRVDPATGSQTLVSVDGLLADPYGIALGTGGLPPPACKGRVATIVGSEGNDVLIGTAGDDVIIGLAGNDGIQGRGGNDLMCGGLGADVLEGGDGRDVIFGQAGADLLDGGPGADQLIGDKGNDTLLGKSGPDELYGGTGDDTMDGGTEIDFCVGASDVTGDTAVNCEAVQGVP